jgi:hypothetical protein
MSLKRWCCALVALLGISLPLAAQAPKGQFVRQQLVFEPNQGQADPGVQFLSHGNGHSVLLREADAVFAFANPAAAVRMKLVGKNPRSVVEGVELQGGVSNYLLGNDPSAWHSSVPHFAKVKYTDVYPGIDLIYYGNDRQLEYDFIVDPHADPSLVQLDFEGADKVSIGAEGDLVLRTPAGEFRHQRPIAFQMRKGVRTPVEAHFVLKGTRATFELGSYDRALPLVIDPKFLWATYMGGPGDDLGNDVALDPDGNVYVTGLTQAITSDPAGIFNPPAGNGYEVFVTKINPAGAVVYTTYIGGSEVDESHSLALDAAGNIYIAGYTTSGNFPVVNAFQATRKSFQDAYALKLDKNGSTIVYSTYLGGGQSDRAFGIVVDPAGNAIVAGNTLSSDFPVSAGFQSRFGGGLGDAFITKFTPAGAVTFSTFLGGSGNDQAYDVARDSDGNIIVTGFTTSQNFPTLKALYANYRGGSDDIFITKLNPSGTAQVFSTYFGGSQSDNGVRLAVDKDNKIYVTGYTASYDFPLKKPAQLFHGGFGTATTTTFDAFLIKMNADGQDADFSTYIGGEDNDGGVSIAVDNDGFIYMAGFTTSIEFYAINALSGFLHGIRDGFVMKVAPDASSLVYSSYLGGFGQDGATAVALDSAANLYVTGFTLSFDFPVAPDTAFQGATAGGQDGFIVKINADDVKTSSPFTISANGGFKIATAGQTANPIFGVASVDVASGLAPAGLAIIDLRSQGLLVNEISIPAPTLTYTGRFYARTSTSDSTAITIYNPNATEVEVSFYFTAGETSLYHGAFKLPANAQTSSLLNQEPFNIPTDVEGTLTFSTTGPVAAVALRSDAAGTNAVNTYVPIFNPYFANKNPVTIPEFVDGGGWTTRIFLVNPTEETITGEIRLFKSGEPGQPGLPSEIATEQGVGSTFIYSIPPRARYILLGRGEQPTVASGYADIVPTNGSFAPHAFATLQITGAGVVATTVESMSQTSSFRMYVESTGTFPEALAATPTIAIANSQDFPATVTLTLTGLDGTPTNLSGQVSLPPRAHIAKFLKEIPGFENLPSPFYGVLKATTQQGGITFAGFRGRVNEQGTFLMVATGPVNDIGTMNPVIFPHIVDGGGYATQFILMDVPGSGSTGAINYLNPSGKPLNMGIEQ